MSHKYKFEETINYSKSEVITSIKSIINPSLIKGLYIFDKTGATSTITDQSGNSHTLTLRSDALAAINASTFSPSTRGLSPTLTLDATHLFDIADDPEFTFIAGVPFSIMHLGIFTDLTNSTILAKSTTVGNQREWIYKTGAADKLQIILSSLDGSKSIGRTYDTALTENTVYSLGISYDGGITSASLKLYVNGSNVAVIDSDIVDVFVGMANGTALIGSYQDAVVNPYKGKYMGVLVVNEELTTTQITLLDIILRGYAGEFV